MSGDLRGSVSHESGISPAKMWAKDAIKVAFFSGKQMQLARLIGMVGWRWVLCE